ncbi:MAG: PepSY-like domain-containing protein [bacterium]
MKSEQIKIKFIKATVMSLIFLFIAATGYVNPANASVQTIPAAVTEAFMKKFPEATNVKWGKENAHEYEASFKNNGIKFSANFSDKGEWMETETGMLFENLPAKIQEAYNKEHKGSKVKASAMIENANGTKKYEVEYKKGGKTVELFYDENGNSVSE